MGPEARGPVPNTQEAPCLRLAFVGGPGLPPPPRGPQYPWKWWAGRCPMPHVPWPAHHCRAGPKPALFSCTTGHHCPLPSAGREDSVKELARVGAGDSMGQQAGDAHGRRGLRSGAETWAAGPACRGRRSWPWPPGVPAAPLWEPCVVWAQGSEEGCGHRCPGPRPDKPPASTPGLQTGARGLLLPVCFSQGRRGQGACLPLPCFPLFTHGKPGVNVCPAVAVATL